MCVKVLKRVRKIVLGLVVGSLAILASSSWADHHAGTVKVGVLHSLSGTMAISETSLRDVVLMAVEEINEAGGVLGSPVEVVHSDSSDTANPQIAAQSVADMISDGVSAIVGAASSSVSLNVVDDIAAAEVVQISPANTSNTTPPAGASATVRRAARGRTS